MTTVIVRCSPHVPQLPTTAASLGHPAAPYSPAPFCSLPPIPQVLYGLLQGILLVLLIINLIYHISFQPRLAVIGGSVALALPDLLHLLLVFVMVSAMLAVLLGVVYGYKLQPYATFSDALVNTVGNMIGISVDNGVLPDELWLVSRGLTMLVGVRACVQPLNPGGRSAF